MEVPVPYQKCYEYQLNVKASFHILLNMYMPSFSKCLFGDIE